MRRPASAPTTLFELRRGLAVALRATADKATAVRRSFSEGGSAEGAEARPPCDSMREVAVRSFGLAIAASYGAFIVWMYVRQPQSVAEVTGGLTASLGAYHVNQQSFDEGLRFFRNDQFTAARLAFDRADPAHQDARTRFFVAYTFYREGWGRLYHDDMLFAQGMDAVDQAIALDPRGTLVIDDPDLPLRSPGELKGELEAGLRSDPSDLNPFSALRRRK